MNAEEYLNSIKNILRVATNNLEKAVVSDDDPARAAQYAKVVEVLHDILTKVYKL